MPTTKEKKAAAIKHILETVFALDPDSNIHKALKENDLVSPFDIVSMSDKDISLLSFKQGNQATYLSKGHIGKLTAFNAFCMHRQINGTPLGENDWDKITEDEFNKFCSSPNFKRWQLNGPPAAAKVVDPVRAFKKRI